jgi:hypothetical protein
MRLHGSTGTVTVIRRDGGCGGWPWIATACNSGNRPPIELSQGARFGVQSTQAELASQLQEPENMCVNHMQIIQQHRVLLHPFQNIRCFSSVK